MSLSQCCPCGTERQPAVDDTVTFTPSLLSQIALSVGYSIANFIDPLLGRVVNVDANCAECPPVPQTPTLRDWEDPAAIADIVLQNAVAQLWNQWCQCSACPPRSDCSAGAVMTVTPADGYCPPSNVPPPTDPDYPCQELSYVLPAGSFFVQTVTGSCYAVSPGLQIGWTTAHFDPPHGRVIIATYTNVPVVSWDRAVYGDTVTVYQDGGGAVGPAYTWPDDGLNHDAGNPPPSCDPTTVCTALEYVYETLNQVQRTVDQLDWFVRGVGGEQTISLPAITNTLTGTLVSLIQQATTAVMPIMPDQLTAPRTTVLTSGGTVGVTEEWIAEIRVTSAPDWMKWRGATAEVYYGKTGSPGPGWVLVATAEGIAEYYDIRYPDGLSIFLPPSATGLIFEITPGVTISCTTYSRRIPAP